MNSSGICSESESFKSSAVPTAGKSFRIHKVLPIWTLPVAQNPKTNIFHILMAV